MKLTYSSLPLVALGALLALALAFSLVIPAFAQTSTASPTTSPVMSASPSASPMMDSTGTSTTGTTGSTDTTGATGDTSTPGLPNTGAGGNAAATYAILFSSAAIALGGIVYMLRRYA